MVLVEAHQDAILDDAAVIVQQHRVIAVPVLHLAHVARHDAVQQGLGLGALDFKDLFAGHVQQAGSLADGPVFFDRVGEKVGLEVGIVQLVVRGDLADRRMKRRVLQPAARPDRKPGIGGNPVKQANSVRA